MVIGDRNGFCQLNPEIRLRWLRERQECDRVKEMVRREKEMDLCCLGERERERGGSAGGKR